MGVGDTETTEPVENVTPPEAEKAFTFLRDNYNKPTIIYDTSSEREANLPRMQQMTETLGKIPWDKLSKAEGKNSYYALDTDRGVVHFLDVKDKREEKGIGAFHVVYKLVTSPDSVDKVDINEPISLEAHITTDGDRPFMIPGVKQDEGTVLNSVSVDFKDSYRTYYGTSQPV